MNRFLLSLFLASAAYYALAQNFGGGLGGGSSTVTVGNVGLIDTGSNPINPSTSDLQQAQLNAAAVAGTSVLPASPTATNALLQGCQYNATQETFTNGQQGTQQCSNRGEHLVGVGVSGFNVSLIQQNGSGAVLFQPDNADAVAITTNLNAFKVTARNTVFNGTSWDRQYGTAGAGVNTSGTYTLTSGNSYSHLTGLATTTIKSGAGVLHSVNINVKGATANIATIYDSTTGSGTVIGVIDTTVDVMTHTYDIAFNTGLTIVTSAGTGGDLTVSWR
jgi:hypothetical protein